MMKPDLQFAQSTEVPRLRCITDLIPWIKPFYVLLDITLDSYKRMEHVGWLRARGPKFCCASTLTKLQCEMRKGRTGIF